jgi:NADPH-ferrihemoprotein reductase
LLVLYGSQTGTAEEFSHTLAEEANQYGFNAIAMDLVDYDPENLPNEKFVVFLVATYGEGEPTDNARDFYEWLKDESHDSSLLENTKFAVFGLGNKQYKIYQAMSRFFDKRLEELGGTRVFKAGEGDADDNIEEDFEDWKANALPVFSETFETNADLGEQVFEPKYSLQIIGDDVDGSEAYITARHLEPDAKNPYLSTVLVNKQLLRPNAENRSTVHVEFDLKGSKVRYEAGDHLAVLAENEPELVNGYISRLGVVDQMSKIIALMHKDGKKGNHFPKKTTLKNVLTYFVDLASLPRKKVLKAFANYAQDEKEREYLKLLSANSDEGKREYHDFVSSKSRSTLDVLNHLKSVKIPLSHFLELMPRLQPRYYSIASSSQIHKDSVHVVVAVVRYKTELGKTKEGVCSSYLERIAPGKKAYIYVRKSHFHLPKDPSTPVLMIGPGTGVAPFVGFLQQRRALKEAGKKLGEAYLYFGCRRSEEDFIYEEHLKEAETNGYISKLHVAFSRDQDKKIYVQHMIKSHGTEIWRNLSKNGYIFICGDAKYMAKDVEETLISIVHEHGNKSKEEARDFIEKMQTDSRYQKDVWAP